MEERSQEEWDGFDISTFKCADGFLSSLLFNGIFHWGLQGRSRVNPYSFLFLTITNLKTGVSTERSYYGFFPLCSQQC